MWLLLANYVIVAAYAAKNYDFPILYRQPCRNVQKLIFIITIYHPYQMYEVIHMSRLRSNWHHHIFW